MRAGESIRGVVIYYPLLTKSPAMSPILHPIRTSNRFVPSTLAVIEAQWPVVVRMTTRSHYSIHVDPDSDGDGTNDRMVNDGELRTIPTAGANVC